MPTTTSEDVQKQDDKLQSQMDPTGAGLSPGKRSGSASDDAPAPRQDDDEDEDEEVEEDDDDADEDLQPDDVEDRDSVGR